MPIVSIIEGICNCVTSIPLNKPHSVPEKRAISMEIGIPRPALYAVPKITAVRAIIEAIDKSISPEIIINVSIIAINPYST